MRSACPRWMLGPASLLFVGCSFGLGDYETNRGPRDYGDRPVTDIETTEPASPHAETFRDEEQADAPSFAERVGSPAVEASQPIRR